MPAAVPIALAVVAATTVYQGVEANQQAQHAKGAAQAQQHEADDQAKQLQATDAATTKAKSDSAASTQSAAVNAMKAAMSATGGGNGTILTSGTGAAPAQTQTKTLLGL